MLSNRRQSKIQRFNKHFHWVGWQYNSKESEYPSISHAIDPSTINRNKKKTLCGLEIPKQNVVMGMPKGFKKLDEKDNHNRGTCWECITLIEIMEEESKITQFKRHKTWNPKRLDDG